MNSLIDIYKSCLTKFNVVKDSIKAIRFEEDEVEYLEAQAKKDKRKLSDFMRCDLLRDKGVGWGKYGK